jgi:hypothetical protein
VNVVLDEEEVAQQGYDELLARLSRLSVTKHFDAYADVDWDAAAMQIDPTDPRWELSVTDGLGASDWYRAQPQEVRATIGLRMIASKMKIGLEFESVLKRGLLEYATTLPNRDPEFRYVYHEVIEEAQHSLMFQEFVNRSGLDVKGMPKGVRYQTNEIVKLGRRFPPLFFLFVLGGEDPIDYVQRQELRSGAELHPLLERIMRIHVTEEARHLSFARHYMKRRVPSLNWVQRQILGFGAPLILGAMAQMMLAPSPELIKTYRIPRFVVRRAYRKNPDARRFVYASLTKVRRLAAEIGIINPVTKLVWKAFRIWEPATTAPAH